MCFTALGRSKRTEEIREEGVGRDLGEKEAERKDGRTQIIGEDGEKGQEAKGNTDARGERI